LIIFIKKAWVREEKRGKTLKARVFVTMKRGVLEPQGRAVARSLDNLGYSEVKGVRIGKVMDSRITRSK
jgi:phosphoribosylformylglycinamidine synthase